MNENVKSTCGFTTVRSSPYVSAIGCQYCDAGAAERVGADAQPAPRIASKSMTCCRSSTYGVIRSRA